MDIICFGDSITQATFFAESDRWPNILQMKLEELAPGKYKLYNRGINGNTSSQGLDRMATDVLPHLPCIVLVEFGFNDANHQDWRHKARVSLQEYRMNLTEIHRIIKKRKGKPVFIINHLIKKRPGKQGNGKSYNANYEPYNKAVRALAHKLGAANIDLEKKMKRRKVELNRFVSEDGLHLSPWGNHLYAEMIFEGLVEEKIV